MPAGCAMADGIEVTLEGIDDMARRLRDVPIALRKRCCCERCARGADHLARRQGRRAGAQAAGAVSKAWNREKAISVRTSKVARKSGDVGVFVGVKPLRGARQKKLGTRWCEEESERPVLLAFPGVRHPARPGQKFLTHAASNKASAALDAAIAEVAPAIEKMDRR